MASFDSLDKKTKDEINQLFDKATDFLKDNKISDALGCFNKILVLDPNHHFALLNKASWLAQLGMHRRALEAIDTALKQDPKSYKALLIKGSIFQDLTRYEEAVNTYLEAITINPNDIPYISMKNLGISLFKLQRYNDAIKIFGV